MIREFGETVGDAVLHRIGRTYGRVQERTALPADLLESEEEYLVVFDAPGATASDVQVRYVGDRVLVRLDRFREFHEGFEMRFPGRGLALDGELELPDDAVVDADAARATLTDYGTLEVRLPKREGVATDDEPEASGSEGDDDGADAAGDSDGADANTDSDEVGAAGDADADDE